MVLWRNAIDLSEVGGDDWQGRSYFSANVLAQPLEGRKPRRNQIEATPARNSPRRGQRTGRGSRGTTDHVGMG